MGKKGDYSLLDIGCGEGFLLQFFHDRGKRVKGIDIGSYALEHFHPGMLPFFEKGNMETLLPVMAECGETYDVVNIDRCRDMVDDVDVCLDYIEEGHGQSVAAGCKSCEQLFQPVENAFEKGRNEGRVLAG